MKKRITLVALAVASLCACGGSSTESAPAVAATASVVTPASTSIAVAWELETRTDDPNRPKTHVVVVASGATPDRIDGGELFGECKPMSPNAWLAAEKPLAKLECGYAGNYQIIGIFQVGNTLVLKAQPVMDDETPPPAPNLLGRPITIPANASITIAPTASASPARCSLDVVADYCPEEGAPKTCADADGKIKTIQRCSDHGGHCNASSCIKGPATCESLKEADVRTGVACNARGLSCTWMSRMGNAWCSCDGGGKWNCDHAGI